MRNEFQKLVDHELSGLQWDERTRQRVLHAIPEEEKPVKQKMTAGMVFVLVLMVACSVALAAGLMFSPRYDLVKQADEALLENYGITDEMLSFFGKRVEIGEQETKVYYISIPELARAVGEYRVTLQGGKTTAEWSFDNAPEKGWKAEKLAEVLEICQKNGGYGVAVTEAQQAAGDDSPEWVSDSAMAEVRVMSEEEVKSIAVLSVDEMDELAREAIQQRFGLKKEQMAKMQLEMESSVWMMQNGRPVFPAYYWLAQSEEGWSKGDGIYIVNVDIRTGEVDQITYDVGLLGNG